MQNDENEIIWRLKGLAIVSVVCAHCNVNPLNEVSAYFAHVLANVGSVGVGIFFWASGYYFRPDGQSFFQFLKLRFEKLVIPWVVAATCVWLYVVLRKSGISFLGWCSFVLGYQSIYYFMTNLLIIQCVMFMLSRLSRINGLVCIWLLIVNISAIMYESVPSSIFPTQYLNPLCFIGYFALGMYMRQNYKGLLQKISKTCGMVLGLCTVVLLASPIRFSYFENFMTLPYELFFIVGSFCLISKCYCVNLSELGKNSFFIYLWHIPIAGIVSNLGNRSNIANVACILWPSLIIFTVFMSMKFLQSNLSRDNRLLVLIRKFSGLRIDGA